MELADALPELLFGGVQFSSFSGQLLLLKALLLVFGGLRGVLVALLLVFGGLRGLLVAQLLLSAPSRCSKRASLSSSSFGRAAIGAIIDRLIAMTRFCPALFTRAW